MSQKKVLVVEDDDSVREIYSRMLRDRYRVIEARDGSEAVEMYRKEKPDLVLVDINLPLKTGGRVISEIKEQDPEAKIIAVTAYAYTKEELGVEVLRKGFSKKVLLAKVGSMLGE